MSRRLEDGGNDIGDYKDHYRQDVPVKRARFFEDVPVAHSTPPPEDPQRIVEDAVPDQFLAGLKSVIGEIDKSLGQSLYSRSKGNIETAVNIYLDQQASGAARIKSSPPPHQRSTAPHHPGGEPPIPVDSVPPVISRAAEEVRPDLAEDPQNVETGELPAVEHGEQNVESDEPSAQLSDEHRQVAAASLRKNWVKRYVGSFQAIVWATRSGTGLVRFGEKLAVTRVQTDSAVKDNYVVRIAKRSNNLEFARLSESDARFAAVLLDSGLCEFTATCIYADERLRLGDSFITQIDCFLLKSAFFADIAPPLPALPSKGSSNSKAQFIESQKESPAEKLMRLRQVGLVKLFNKLDLTTTDFEPADYADPPQHQQSTLTQAQDADVVQQDELDALYKRSNPPDYYLDEVTPPDTFALELRSYQKKGLNWMIQKETPEGDLSSADTEKEPMHPLWQAFKWPSQQEHMEEQVSTNCGERDGEKDPEDTFYVNLYSGELSLSFPRQKKSVLGGILADEMGLGKTISTLALVHANKYNPQQIREPKSTSDASYAKHTTLVVAPMSLLSQWESEVNAASKPGTLRAMVYYGSSAGANLRTLLCKQPANQVPNVVITSYGTLLSEHAALQEFLNAPDNKQKFKYENWYDNLNLDLFGLYGVEFYRVVLDEAHTIRNRAAKTSKACYDLRAARRWALTGTPIVNKLEDLYSVIKFLGVEPWNNFSFWRAFITAPFESKGYIQAMNVVQSVMEPLVLRRTKDMKQPNGAPLVELPPKTVSIHRIRLSKDERDLYSYVYTRVRRSFDSSLEAGAVLRSYTSLLAQIMRLRQVCCHPGLVARTREAKRQNSKDTDNSKQLVADEPSETVDSDRTTRALVEDDDLQAMVANFTTGGPDTTNAPIEYPSQVAQDIMSGNEQTCALCLESIEPENMAVASCWHVTCLDCILQHIEYRKDRGEIPKCPTCRSNISTDEIYRIVQRPNNKLTLRPYKRQSAKIKELMRQLYTVRREDPQFRVVVFSQFVTFLSIIAEELEREEFTVLRFDGSMSQHQRATVLDRFQSTPASVLLISLTAGGVGLNLVCANRVYLMDPWWSPAVEAQAIDRIHRMGQRDPVTVVRFVVEGTVEERMLKIQERKKLLAGSTLGLSEEEKRERRLEDIKMLFE
ncbi:DNA repair protein Rad5p [Trichomonascus vanleenenianus]|uniref:DNA helicase RAD5 n=1 Tax=Trichomonascus vanleenenianus TaxID=2268995 RepID=UPI003ECB7EEA